MLFCAFQFRMHLRQCWTTLQNRSQLLSLMRFTGHSTASLPPAPSAQNSSTSSTQLQGREVTSCFLSRSPPPIASPPYPFSSPPRRGVRDEITISPLIIGEIIQGGGRGRGREKRRTRQSMVAASESGASERSPLNCSFPESWRAGTRWRAGGGTVQENRSAFNTHLQ